MKVKSIMVKEAENRPFGVRLFESQTTWKFIGGKSRIERVPFPTKSEATAYANGVARISGVPVVVEV